MNPFVVNRNKLINVLPEASCLLLFSGRSKEKAGDIYYPFSVDANFYYISGIETENAAIIITKTKSASEELLFIEPSDPLKAKWIGEKISSKEASEVSGIKKVFFIESLSDELKRRVNETNSFYLDFGGKNKANRDVLSLIQGIPKPFLNAFPYLSRLRMTKEDWEINNIKKAIDITEAGFRKMFLNIRPGMKEYGVEAWFDFELKSRGIRQTAFETIAAAGKNAAVLHYTANDSEIKEGELLLVDAGASFSNYCADITRTFPANGKFSKEQKTLYNIVLDGQSKVISAIKPGATLMELNNILLDFYYISLKEIGFISEHKDIGRYYYHSVSHHLGLWSHDPGAKDIPLEPGMVITAEPGLYFEELGIGIRIEDDILVTKTGNINLSTNIIKTVEEIEAFMSEGIKNGRL